MTKHQISIPLIDLKTLRWEMVHLAKLIFYSKFLDLKNSCHSLLGKNQSLIHIIGDSHAFSFTNSLFSVHYAGAATAHNLINKGSTSKSGQNILKILTKIKDPTRSLLILVFGEIDCRIQIYHQYRRQNRKTSMKELIAQTINKYGEFLLELKKQKYNLAVFNVVPQGEQSNVYGFTYYADRKIRCHITSEFNHLLKWWCLKHKVVFINIFDKLVDDNSNRIESYKLDRVHYNTILSKLLTDFIKQDSNLSKFL